MKLALRMLAGLLVAAAFAAGGMALWVDAELDRPYADWQGDHVDVTVPAGAGATSVARVLGEAGVVERPRLLVGWLWWTDRTGAVRAGEYRFDRPRSVRDVAEVLIAGRVLLRPVTVPEGSTRWEVARAIERAGFGDYEVTLRQTERVGLISDLDPEAVTLEGYLYPETYMAAATDGPAEIVEAMVARFRRHWDAPRRAAAARLGMGLREVVTLASIVEAETPASYERALVSAVFHNRLRRGMLLQTDPTVLYAKFLAGLEERTIRRSDLRRDSPYNTYVVAGLPAGPIGNPRAASIDAALYPADVEYLYFVSRNDGTHVFSRTLSEHNRWVNLYQR
jgi:UPF0755 protein